MHMRFILCAGLLGAAVSAASATSGEAGQDLELRACRIGRGGQGECGRMSVPENRSVAAGRRIAINFQVLRAQMPGAKEAVLLLAGGPGQGSTAMIGTASGWMSPLRASMDMVLMDQRGTGGSGALTCDMGAGEHPAAAFGHIMPVAAIERCRQALERRADLTQYTTDAAVADMEELRVRLGYDRIALFGVSYGTRLAQAYMRRHPARTKAVVIDGVLPFDVGAPVTYARGLQRSVDLMLAACRDREACRQANPQLAEDLASIVTRLDKAPARATVRPRTGDPVEVTLTRGDFAYAMRGMLYSPASANDLPPMIARAAATGDLSEFAQRYWARATNLGRSIARGLHLSILCPEDVVHPTEAEATAAAAGTILGRHVFDDYRTACAIWPKGKIAQDFRAPVTANVPVLLVSGQFDPVTPPEFGDRVARSLPLARHIVVAGSGHGSASGCPRAAVLHVLGKGTLEGMPAVCGG
jgi:pimeloyl-ACP methyl ester carboxylesterase